MRRVNLRAALWGAILVAVQGLRSERFPDLCRITWLRSTSLGSLINRRIHRQFIPVVPGGIVLSPSWCCLFVLWALKQQLWNSHQGYLFWLRLKHWFGLCVILYTCLLNDVLKIIICVCLLSAVHAPQSWRSVPADGWRRRCGVRLAGLQLPPAVHLSWLWRWDPLHGLVTWPKVQNTHTPTQTPFFFFFGDQVTLKHCIPSAFTLNLTVKYTYCMYMPYPDLWPLTHHPHFKLNLCPSAAQKITYTIYR